MTSVKVAVRVRPSNDREDGNSTIIEMDGNKTKIINPKLEMGGRADRVRDDQRQREFTFDHSFWSFDPLDSHFVTQNQIFESLGPDMLEAVYEGYNICVFAYGQTGSGKTFTMMGNQKNPGFIPRFCEALFARMNDPGGTYRTQVSFLEIYNEKVRDLLKSGVKSDHKLRIREHQTEGPYVEGLSQHTVVSFQSIIQLIARGNTNRVTVATQMNDASSRSHAIFTITFTQAKMLNGMPSERQSKIHLVDLAGSEKATGSGWTEVRLKEGGNINKSLVTLGNVISALAEMGERSGSSRRSGGFIPYRDSKLTYLLRDSLGGNAQTIMIATISPSAVSYGESLSTLKYANRAKNIINKPTVNEDSNVRLIRELRMEIFRLKTQLAGNAGKATIMPSVHEELHEKETRMKELTDEWTDKWRQAASILQEEENLELRKEGGDGGGVGLVPPLPSPTSSEEENLELRKEGVGVILDSSLPHLISLEDDVLSTGVMLYHLKKGLTKIGTEQSLEIQDIVISGEEAQPDHCVIEYVEGVVTLHPIEDSSCSVNGVALTSPSKLTQGALIQLGKSSVFRFNYPEEAEKLKQIRKSLSSLSLSKSPPRTTSHISLPSHSLTELYNSSDSLPLSLSSGTENNENSSKAIVCDNSVNTQSEWEGGENRSPYDTMVEERRKEAEELEEIHKGLEREWLEQQRHLEEKLASKEQELCVLQDCMQIVSQIMIPKSLLEQALRRLENEREARLEDTQHTRQQLAEALQEVASNFAASQSSVKMAVNEMDNMIASRQLMIASIEEENQTCFKGLLDELCQEKEKGEAAEDELWALRSQMEEEKKRLLNQKGGRLKNSHARLTHAILRLREEHQQLDQEKHSRWNLALHCCLQDYASPDLEPTQQPSTQRNPTTDTQNNTTDTQNNDVLGGNREDPIHSVQFRLKAAEDRLGSASPPLLLRVKSEMETWLSQKDGELWRLKKKRSDLLQSHSKCMAALSRQAEAKETEMGVQREKCQELKKTLHALHEQVRQGVEELEGEQHHLRELRERKVKEGVEVAKEREEREGEITRRMKELQEVADAEMEKVQVERERLLGLQTGHIHSHLLGQKSGVTSDPGEDALSSVPSSSSVSGESAASEILRERGAELERKAWECQELREKIEALEQELTTSRRQHTDEHQTRLYNVELEKEFCMKALVDQEVRLRLFAESVERRDERRAEREQQRAEREREIQAIKQRQKKELDDLRATLSSNDVYCPSIQTQTSDSSTGYRQKLVRQLSYGGSPSQVEISIPRYGMRGSGASAHYEYEVKVRIGAESWSVLRRYGRFKELHHRMKKLYPDRYLQGLMRVCRANPQSPLHPDNHLHLTKHILAHLDSFFRRGLFETALHDAC
ncbi:hypothetical protein ACOMHN_020776 [Nucella lapillus]